MKTLLIPADQISEAAAVIRRGGLVVFPTETVYGLGASAFNPVACVRIFTAKGRPSDNPLIVHIASWEQLDQVAVDIPAEARKLAETFWPGPLTLVLPKHLDLPEIVTSGLPTVAVRWPANVEAQKFLLESGVPVAAPSANVSGAPSPTNFEMAKSAMLGRVEAILQGDDAEVGLESTIVAFANGEVKVLRPGSITLEQIAQTLGLDPKDLPYQVPQEGRPISPGLKYTHYKPAAEVQLFREPSELKSWYDQDVKVGLMVLEGSVPEGVPSTWEVLKFADWDEYARYLYASFHELDQLCCALILAQLPEASGLGLAITNRLQKAAGTV
jgi:L-threonylcarbamoyladenylate synthase